MTGVQTCALPICFPVTILAPTPALADAVVEVLCVTFTIPQAPVPVGVPLGFKLGSLVTGLCLFGLNFVFETNMSP